jgi:hypothetical protein
VRQKKSLAYESEEDRSVTMLAKTFFWRHLVAGTDYSENGNTIGFRKSFLLDVLAAVVAGVLIAVIVDRWFNRR